MKILRELEDLFSISFSILCLLLASTGAFTHRSFFRFVIVIFVVLFFWINAMIGHELAYGRKPRLLFLQKWRLLILAAAFAIFLFFDFLFDFSITLICILGISLSLVFFLLEMAYHKVYKKIDVPVYCSMRHEHIRYSADIICFGWYKYILCCDDAILNCPCCAKCIGVVNQHLLDAHLKDFDASNIPEINPEKELSP